MLRILQVDVQSFIIVKADPRGSYPVTLIVGDDFHTTAPLDAAK